MGYYIAWNFYEEPASDGEDAGHSSLLLTASTAHRIIFGCHLPNKVHDGVLRRQEPDYATWHNQRACFDLKRDALTIDKGHWAWSRPVVSIITEEGPRTDTIVVSIVFPNAVDTLSTLADGPARWP
jgi:hypothetical protein